MIRKIFFTIVFFCCFIKSSFAIVCPVWNQAPTERCDITIESVKIYNADTEEWITVIENNQVFDFASVNSGDTIGQYGSQVNDFTVGVYDKAKITISKSVTFSHHFVDTEGFWDEKYTTADYWSDHQAGLKDTAPSEAITLNLYEIPYDIPAGYSYVETAGSFEWEVPISFTKTENSTQKIIIKFDIESVSQINCGDNVSLMMPIPYITFE